MEARAQNTNVVRLPMPPGVFKAPSRPKRHAEGDDELWLISYADMVTLLFCFMVVLLSVSKIDVARVSGLKQELTETFSDEKVQVRSLNDMEKQLKETVSRAGLSEQVQVRSTDRGLVLDLNARVLFAPGSSELSLQAMDLLDRLTGPLSKEPVQLVVEGHTDPIPMRSAQFPSNWELSAARATSVVRYMITALHFEPRRLAAMGLADTRPIDSEGNVLEEPPVREGWTESYLARQRRVTLVVTPLPTQAPAGPGPVKTGQAGAPSADLQQAAAQLPSGPTADASSAPQAAVGTMPEAVQPAPVAAPSASPSAPQDMPVQAVGTLPAQGQGELLKAQAYSTAAQDPLRFYRKKGGKGKSVRVADNNSGWAPIERQGAQPSPRRNTRQNQDMFGP